MERIEKKITVEEIWGKIEVDLQSRNENALKSEISLQKVDNLGDDEPKEDPPSKP